MSRVNIGAASPIKRTDAGDVKAVLHDKDVNTNGHAMNKPGGLEFKAERTKEEHIKYFRDLVADETFYEESLDKQWEERLKKTGTEAIAEEGADQIRLAIGMSRLFRKQKMQQFVGLIDECEKGATTTSPTDLAGFWEMIYMQVQNIHERFDNLDVLAANGWKTPQKARTAVDGAKTNGTKKLVERAEQLSLLTGQGKAGAGRAKSTAPSVQASSKIREAIEKARAAKAAQSAADPGAVSE